MGIPMIKCAICGQEITKRQSLLIEPYGRICRSHPEVEQHKAKLAEIAAKASEDKKLTEAIKSLQVIGIAVQLRMMAYMSQLPVEFVMMATLYKLPKDMREAVREEVRQRGDMTDAEMSEAIGSALFMAAKMRQENMPESEKVSEATKQEEASNSWEMPTYIDNPKEELALGTFEEGGLYKYVRFGDGKVLFSKNTGFGCVAHKDIADCGYTHPILPGDKFSGTKPPAVSAGTIQIRFRDNKWQWFIHTRGSMSTKLPSLESDEKYIQQELGDRFTYNYELIYG